MISRKEILQRIYKVAKENLDKFPTDKVITEDMSLIDDLGLDSLDKIEIWLGVEEEFVIDIPDGEVRKINTVGDMINLVIKYQELKK
jgi:acyl carrier protein